MESVAPALEEVLRQFLEDGVFRVKLHATVSMRRGDEVEEKTFYTGNNSARGPHPRVHGRRHPRARDGDDGASARWG